MKTRPIPLPDEFVKAAFTYDPETGVIFWKIGGDRIRGKQACVWKNTGKYRAVPFMGLTIVAHRLAWFLHHGKWPEQVIDHINGVRSDNRIANLRDVSQSINAQNRTAIRVNTKSGYLGVKPNRSSKKNPWQAQIRFPLEDRVKYLGCFPTAEEAHAAYIAAKREIHPGSTL